MNSEYEIQLLVYIQLKQVTCKYNSERKIACLMFVINFLNTSRQNSKQNKISFYKANSNKSLFSKIKIDI